MLQLSIVAGVSSRIGTCHRTHSARGRTKDGRTLVRWVGLWTGYQKYFYFVKFLSRATLVVLWCATELWLVSYLSAMNVETLNFRVSTLMWPTSLNGLGKTRPQHFCFKVELSFYCFSVQLPHL